MEDWSIHLLSKEKLRDLAFYLERTRQEQEKYASEHDVISRYHRRLWFQRAWQKTESELLERYRHLAFLLEWGEEIINDCERKMYMHSAAVEELHKSMKPFENMDFKIHTLEQTSMF